MTNFERITQSPKTLKDFLQNEYPLMVGFMPYMDFDAYCNTNKRKDFQFMGDKCTIDGFSNEFFIMVNENTSMLGAPYCTCIGLDSYRLVKVPKENVVLLEGRN